jgi:transposase
MDGEGHRQGAGFGSHSNQHSAQAGAPGAERYRRVEIITGTQRRRRWPANEKARITEESFAPGASVSAVARRHGVGLGLLHHWRRLARDSGRVEALQFVPIRVAGEPAVPTPQPSSAGTIEIEVCGVRICLRGAVDGVALRTVLSAVRVGM